MKKYSKYNYSKNNKCLDCGKLITRNSTRCKKCYYKTLKGKTGKDTHNYKDGRTSKKYYCTDCGKKILYNCAKYGSHKCKSCFRKGYKISNETKRKISESLTGRKRPEISEKMEGKLNYGWKGGKPKCKNCGKETNYKSKYCWTCYVSLGLNRGENAPNYIHGLSSQKYPPEFNTDLKQKIRKRDNYKCQLCDRLEKNNNRKLSIHHIDYNKNNNNEDNLITLCINCHVKTNNNRNYWKEYFKREVNYVKY